MFDLAKPDARAIPSSFGGGWIVALTDEGRDFLASYFGDEAQPWAPLGNQIGWIVEPADSAALAEALREAGIAWEVGQNEHGFVAL